MLAPNHVFYWAYGVGYAGVLLRDLDRYGTFGTGFGAGTGAGMVQVRYDTWVRKPYPCTIPTVPVPCTQIAAEIAADLPYRTRTDRTHVPYPYRTCTVPAPVPAPKPVPTVPYPSKPLSKTPSYPTS